MARPSEFPVHKLLRISNEMDKQLQDFRFERRFKSEADALRDALRLGLVAHAAGLADVLDRSNQEKFDRLSALLKDFG